MKKISAIGLLIIMTAFASNAQNIYSKQNLEKASQEELNLYLKQAKNQKAAGTFLSIAGPITVTTILIVGNTADTNLSLDAAVAIFFIGAGATLIGIPLAIVGSSRVKKVKNTLSDRVSIEIAPCSFQNYTAQKQTTWHNFSDKISNTK